MRHTVGQRIGLALAGAGDDQQRTSVVGVAMLDGAPLFRIELVEIGGSHGESIPSERRGSVIPVSFANASLTLRDAGLSVGRRTASLPSMRGMLRLGRGCRTKALLIAGLLREPVTLSTDYQQAEFGEQL
jgi:hypothetical protein